VAVFGTTAILFETKTKRLTEASKQGDMQKLVHDVEQGIIEAQQQLNNSKNLILSRDYDQVSSREKA
jgi:hypothetical protein